MLQITVKFGEPLRRVIGQRRVSFYLSEDATVADLLALLAQRYAGFEVAFRGDDLGRPHPYILFINGRPVTAANYGAVHLQEQDIVHLVLPVVGGGHA